ncbi:MAG: hypothetical protein AB1391_01180 [Candidatus Micrarchaeota archaeon]
MLSNIISNSVKKYTDKPIYFIYPVFLSVFFTFIIALTAVAIFLLIFFISASFNLMDSHSSIVLTFASFVAFIFLAYCMVANLSAMLNCFMTTEISRPHMFEYLRYAIKNSLRFFTIFAIGFGGFLILNLPIIIVFIIFKPELFSLFGIVLLILCGFNGLVYKFIFSFVGIAAVVKNISAIEAIKSGIRFVIKNFIDVFIFNILCLIMWITLLIPILNIVVFFSFYPIIFNAMANFYKIKS